MAVSSRPLPDPTLGMRCRGLATSAEARLAMPCAAPCPTSAPPGNDPSGVAEVLVVFVDHAGCLWLRLLKHRFRHCFAVLRAGPLWLACDPLKDRIDLDVLDLPPGFDLARFYSEQGHRVLVGRRPSPGPRRSFALAPLTCVTVVKRLLALHAPLVYTPAQLHTHLVGPAYRFRPWAGSSTPPPGIDGSPGPGPTQWLTFE